MDRVESLIRSFRRAASSQMGERCYADLLLDANRELVMTESRSKARTNGRGTKEFAKAALEDLEEALRRLPPAVARGPDAAAVAFAIVPVRMRAPPAVAQARAAAAGPIHTAVAPPMKILHKGVLAVKAWIKSNSWWLSVILAVLFPKLIVAVVMRTGKAMTSQF